MRMQSKNTNTGGSFASKASTAIGRHISIAAREIDYPSTSRHETDEGNVNSKRKQKQRKKASLIKGQLLEENVSIVGEEPNSTAAFGIADEPTGVDAKARTSLTSTFLFWARRLLSAVAGAAVSRARLVYFAVFSAVVATMLFLLIIGNDTNPISKTNTAKGKGKGVKLIRRGAEDDHPLPTLRGTYLSITSHPKDRDPLLVTQVSVTSLPRTSQHSYTRREAATSTAATANSRLQHFLHVPYAKLIGEDSVWVGGGVLSEIPLQTTISERRLRPAKRERKRQNPIGWGLREGSKGIIITVKPISCQANQTASDRFDPTIAIVKKPRGEDETVAMGASTRSQEEGPEEARTQIALTEILVRAMQSIADRHLVDGPSIALNDNNDVDHGLTAEMLKTPKQKSIYEFFLSTFEGGKVKEREEPHTDGDDTGMSLNSCVFSDMRTFETAKFSKTSTLLWFEELFTAIKAHMYVGGRGGSIEKDTGGTATTTAGILSSSTIEVAPFASPECGVVLPPSHIAQCLLYAVTTMSRMELARLAAEVAAASASSASKTAFSSSSVERYNVFSPLFTKIFSRSLCARAATCVQWVYGTFVPIIDIDDATRALGSSLPPHLSSNNNINNSINGNSTEDDDNDREEEERRGLALLAHFGVELSSLPLRPASSSSTSNTESELKEATFALSPREKLRRFTLERSQWLASARLTDMTPIIPLQRLVGADERQEEGKAKMPVVNERVNNSKRRGGGGGGGEEAADAKGGEALPVVVNKEKEEEALCSNAKSKLSLSSVRCGGDKDMPSSFIMYDDRTERVKRVRSVRDVLKISSCRFSDHGGANKAAEEGKEEGREGQKGVPMLAKGILTSSEITDMLERFVWRSSSRTRTRVTPPAKLATSPNDNSSSPSGGGIGSDDMSSTSNSHNEKFTSNPAFPSLILFSGDSVLRSAFYELISAIRNPMKVVVLPSRSSTLPPRTKKFGGQSWGSAYDGKIFYIRMNEHDALLSNIAHLNPEEANAKPKSSFSWPPTTSNVNLKTENSDRDSLNAVAAKESGKAREEKGRGVEEGAHIELDADASYPFAEIPFSFEELRVLYEPLFDQIVENPMGHTETDLLRILRPITGARTPHSNNHGKSNTREEDRHTSSGVSVVGEDNSENADTEKKEEHAEKSTKINGVEATRNGIRLRQRTFPAPWVLHQLKRACIASTAAAKTAIDKESVNGGSGEGSAYLIDGAIRRQRGVRYGHLCPRFIVAFEFDNHAGNVYETFMPNAISDIMNDWSTNPNEKWRERGTRESLGGKKRRQEEFKDEKAHVTPENNEVARKSHLPPTALPPTFIGAHIHSFGVWQHKEKDIVSRTHSYFTPLLFGDLVLSSAKNTPSPLNNLEGGEGKEDGLLCTNGAVWGGTALDRFDGSSGSSSPSSSSGSSSPSFSSILSFLHDKICFKNNNKHHQHHHRAADHIPPQTLHISRITSGYKHINARDNDNDRQKEKTTDSSSTVQNAPFISFDGHYSRALREATQLFFGPLTRNTSSKQGRNDEGKRVEEGTVGRNCPPGGSALMYGGSVPARYQPLGAKVSADLLAKWGSSSASPAPAVAVDELSKLAAEPLPSSSYSHSFFSSLSLCAHENKTVTGDDRARDIPLGFDLETKDEVLTKRLLEKAVAACLAGGTVSSSGAQNAALTAKKSRRRGGGKRKPDRQSWEYLFSKIRNPMGASARVVHISKLSADAFVFLAHLEGLLRLREELHYKIERGHNNDDNYSGVLMGNRDQFQKGHSNHQLDHFSELLDTYYSSTPEKIPTMPPTLLDQSLTLTPRQDFVRYFPSPQRQRIVDSLDHSDKLLQAAREAILKSLQSKNNKKGRSEFEPDFVRERKHFQDGDADANTEGNTNNKMAKAASNSQTIISPIKHYLYDAMKLQTLYPFASNDYLHFDCHFSVNARKAPWMRLEPRVSAPHAQLMEKIHHGLFTVIDDAYEEEDEENEARRKKENVREQEGSSGSGVGSTVESEKSRLGNRNESSRWTPAMGNLWSAPSGRIVPTHQPLCWEDTLRPSPSKKQEESAAPHSSHLSAVFYNYFLRDVLNTVEGCEEWSLRTGGVLPTMTSFSAVGKSTAVTPSSASPECAVLITHNYNQCRNSFGANELSLILNRMNFEL